MKLSKLGLGMWVLASASLVACGGGSGGSKARNATLGDVVGVWDFSYTEDGKKDEVYTVFRSNGTGTHYDYQGDSNDDAADCYYLIDFDFIDLGNGKFSFDYGDGQSFTVEFTVSGNTLNYEDEDSSDSYKKSDRGESSFTPDCEDVLF